MRRLRVTSALPLLLPAMALCLFAAPTVLAAGADSFSGTVKDTIGNLVGDVEVLVVARSSAALETAAQARSDGEGRFAITGLAPGLYRVAALKDGYLTSIQAVNTRVQSWVDLVLRPVPTGDAAVDDRLPADPDWALRLPRRHVLRETEGEAAPQVATTAPVETAPHQELHMEAAQMFDVGARVDGRSDEVRPQGSATRLQVDSALGAGGSIHVQGLRESIDATQSDESIHSTATRDADALRVGLSHSAGAKARVDVAASMDRQDLQWSTSAAETVGDRRQERTAFGYDTRWTRQLEGSSQVTAAISYHDLQSEQGGSGLRQTHRALRASGRYDSNPLPAHQLTVGLHADLLETPLDAEDSSPGATGGVDRVSGTALGLDAEDTWRLARPFSLIYGVSYRRGLGEQAHAVVVPRVGGAWSLGQLLWRFMVTYHTLAGDGGAALPGDGRTTALAVFEPAGPMGYETEFELTLAPGFRLVGSTAYAPLQLELVGRAGMPFRRGSDPIYLTDGNAAVQRDRLAVIRESTDTRIWVEWNSGQVEGQVAGVQFYDTPFQNMGQRVIDYDNGQFGVHVVASGTDVVLQFMQVDERSGDDLPDAYGTEQRAVELSVMQDVARLRSMGHWRLLLGARLESLRVDGGDETLPDRSLDSRGHRLSAGLSVAF